MTKETEVTLGVTVKANKGSWGAIDDLLLIKEDVDKTDLATAISAAKEKLTKGTHYTKDSLAKLKVQVEEAQAVLQKMIQHKQKLMQKAKLYRLPFKHLYH